MSPRIRTYVAFCLTHMHICKCIQVEERDLTIATLRQRLEGAEFKCTQATMQVRTCTYIYTYTCICTCTHVFDHNASSMTRTHALQAHQHETQALAAHERIRALEEMLRERREQAEEWRRQAMTVQVRMHMCACTYASIIGRFSGV